MLSLSCAEEYKVLLAQYPHQHIVEFINNHSPLEDKYCCLVLQPFVMCVLVSRLCPAYCDPMDCSPLDTLSMGFSRQKYWSGLPCPLSGDLPDFLHCRQILYCLSQQGSPFCHESGSRVPLFATTQSIQSMEFSRSEYWSGYPFPSLGDLPNPGIEPRSPLLQGDSLPAEPPRKPHTYY